ncbi:MAG: type II toxin-antitoxin system HicA family toxin [Acidobacteria bacterium]|nr:type II toxin-antitoxin system HicA family toxin [Acidobacteriota bacterium]
MAKLPALTARKVVRALVRSGFIEDRQKGSHLVMIHPETRARTVVPIHPGRTIKEPLLRAIVRDAKLRAIVRDANLSVDEFLALL